MPLDPAEFNRLMYEAKPKTQPLVDENPDSYRNYLPKVDPAESLFAVEGMKPNAPSAVGDLLRGVDNLQYTGGGVLALIGNATGLKSLEDWGTEIYKNNEMEARQNPAQIGSYENIKGAGDALVYMREAVLENAAMFIPSITTGGIGAIMARGAAEGYVKSLIASVGEEAAAKIVAKRILIGNVNASVQAGGTLGSYASSAGMEIGSIYADTVEETGAKNPGYALGAGLVAGLFDAVPEGFIFKNVLGKAGAAKLEHALIKRLGVEGAKQFVMEAPTEAIQTVIERSAISNEDGSDLFSKENVVKYVDAFAKGGIAGGGMGMVGEGVGSFLRPHPDAATRQHERDITATAESMAEPEVEGVPETPESKRYEEISAEIEKLNGEITAESTPEQQKEVQDKIAPLIEEQAKLEAIMAGDLPAENLVNENTTTENPTVEDFIKQASKPIVPLKSAASATPQSSGLSVLPVSDSPEDVATAMKQSKSLALQEELSFLENSTPEMAGLTTNEFNGRKKEIEAMLADDSKFNTTDNAPTYKFGKSNLSGVEKEQVDASREQGHTSIDDLVKPTDTNKPEAAKFIGALKAAIEPVLNFTAGEGITFTKAAEGRSFQIVPTPNGGIEIQFPSYKTWEKDQRISANKGELGSPTEMFAKYVEHEVIHGSLYSQYRKDWIKDGKRETFGKFVKKRNAQIGSWLRVSYRGLAPQLLAVYDPSKYLKVYEKGQEASQDEVVGSEFMRMLVERARTGLLTEDVAIQAKLAQNGGLATKAYNALIRAIQRMREVMARYLNPKTSTPAIQDIFKQMNDVLDKYGIIQPNPKSPVSEIKAKVDSGPERSPVSQETPKVDVEGSSAPAPDDRELAARRKLDEQKLGESQKNREALVNENSGVPRSKRELLQKIEDARLAIDANASNAAQAVNDAAMAHAKTRIKWGNKLATRETKTEAKEAFEIALQRPVSQAAYDSAVKQVKAEGASQAKPTGPENEIAESLGIDYQGDMMGRLAQFTDIADESYQSYGATFFTPINPNREQVIEKLNQTRKSFGSPLVNENEGASGAKPVRFVDFVKTGDTAESALKKVLETSNIARHKALAGHLLTIDIPNLEIHSGTPYQLRKQFNKDWLSDKNFKEGYAYFIPWTKNAGEGASVVFIDAPNNKLGINEVNRIILHELMHAATEYKVMELEDGKNADSSIVDLNNIYEYVKGLNLPYEGQSLDNISEFITGVMTDRSFRNELRGLQWEGGEKSVFEKVIDALMRAFGLTDEDTLLREAIKDIIEVTKAQSKDSLVNENEGVSGATPLAPNGNPSNLTQRQWEQVRTPEFKNWFGDWESTPSDSSKILDDNGEPRIVFHTTDKGGFNSFQNGYDIGIHAGTTYQGEVLYQGQPDAPISVMPLFVSIKNPLRVRDAGVFRWQSSIIRSMPESVIQKLTEIGITAEPFGFYESEKLKVENLRNALKSIGYDGLIYQNYGEAGAKKIEDSYIAFDPNQLKSAISNNGEFSTEDDGVSMAVPRTPTIIELDRQSTDYLANIFSPSALVNERTEDKISKTIKFDSQLEMPAEAYEYRSKSVKRGAYEAMEYIYSQGGILNAAESLLADPRLADTGLDGDGRTMLRQQLTRGLTNMMRRIVGAEINPSGYNDLVRLKTAMSSEYIRNAIDVGREVNAYKGDELLVDGDSAKNDLINTFRQKWKRYFGDKGNAWLENLTNEMNQRRKDVLNKIITRSEFVAFLSKMMKDIETIEWRRSMRKTIAAIDEKVDYIADLGASMAGRMAFGNFDNEPALKGALNRILSDMTLGIPKAENTEQARTVLAAAIAEITRDQAREAGIIPETPKAVKVTELQKLAEILNNEDLYEQFVGNLEERMINKLGGKSEAPHFREAMANFIDRMNRKAWMDGMLDAVLAERMKKMKVSLTRAIKSVYNSEATGIEEVTAEVKKALAEAGVTDQDIIDSVSQDIDARMEAMVESAKETWAGKPGSIKLGLKDIGFKMMDYIGTGFTNQDGIATKLVEHMTKRLGIADTASHPHARQLNKIVRDALEKMTEAETKAVMTRLENAPTSIRNGLSTKNKRDVTEEIIKYANIGALTNVKAYAALAKKLGLPAYKEEDAAKAEKLGREIANMPDGRERTVAIIELRNFIDSKKGASWQDMMVAGMYSSMLSGPSTMLVNAVSNSINLLSEMYVLAVQNPKNILPIISAIARVFDSGFIEFKETWRTGLSAGKLNVKVEGGNPAEFIDPEFTSDPNSFIPESWQRGTARGLYKALSLTRAKYVVRLLQATDMMFYKAAQEASFAAKTGFQGYGTKLKAFKTEVREQMINAGEEVDTKEGKRLVDLRALERMDLSRSNNPDYQTAWEEAHGDALRITFNQEPQGFIGKASELASTLTSEYPIGKVIIPFTRVVANVLNTQIDWSPFGLIRFLTSDKFKIKKEDGTKVRDWRILIRSLTGMGFLLFVGAFMARYSDDDDPYFAVYGAGPTDANKKRQLYERGWKPNTIKIGSSYISYLTSPVALALSSIGTISDRWKEKPDQNFMDIIPQAALAFVQGTLHQSFLSGAADLISSFDSADPEARMSRIFARTSTLWVPNLFKQVDQWIDPSVQQSDSFMQMVVGQVPIARQMADNKPMLNVFGDPVTRVQGPLGIPFLNRFWTTEKTNDPVFRLLAERNLSVPNYSKQSHIGNEKMTPEQFYEYVSKSGPKIREAIRVNAPRLRTLSREEAQDEINDISEGIKRQTRNEIAQSR